MKDWLKKGFAYVFLATLVQILSGTAVADAQPRPSAGVRPPWVAGRFYPAEAEKLRAAIRFYLEDSIQPISGKPLALIAPHAGYIYSGQICADAYRQTAAGDYDLIVVLGTNHTTPSFQGVSIYPEAGYQTPLGIAAIDKPIARRLIAASDDFTFDPAVHRYEHSIEVQIPFVQTVFPEAKIIAAIVGGDNLDLCNRFAKTLARVIQNRKALIIASSDLSHYPSYEDAVRVDHDTIKAILGLNPASIRESLNQQMRRHIPQLATCACGAAPMITAVSAARYLGAKCGRLISYANSGDVLVGDRSRVVGYAALAFYQNKDCGEARIRPPKDLQPSHGALTSPQKKALLRYARRTIKQALLANSVPLPRCLDPVLEQPRAAFVTLKKNGRLRGCIGSMRPDRPLYRTVGQLALQAAFNDRRFPELKADELVSLEIEISVLTPFEKIQDPDLIQTGRDGVMLKKEGRSAVFLPQVALEQGWSCRQMLAQLCLKAGLPENSWQHGADLYAFRALVFKESDFD